MSEPSPEPFGREDILDKPGIIGARWWHRSLQASDAAVSRRSALGAIAVASGIMLTVGLAVAAASGSHGDAREETRPALGLQQEFGWSFGATTECLTFDGESKLPFDRDALGRIAEDMKPAVSTNLPFYVPTLFQSIAAVPRSAPTEDPNPPPALKSVLKPIFTPRMDTAFRSGRALAALLKGTRDVLLVVDLPGPEAVAFAAGASASFDPVFAFDNWPHPKGVVPAHQTLAAAAYYQPLFAKRAGTSSSSSTSSTGPMVVLDRNRLAPYSDNASQFDNRHVAKVPDAAALRRLRITRVLYVVPSGTTDQDMDDLNDDLVLYARAGLEVRLVGVDAFGPDVTAVPSAGEDRPVYAYGGASSSSGWFFHDYPWAPVPAGAAAPPRAIGGPEWRPNPRVSPFSSGAPGADAKRTRPVGFGTVLVAVSIATGLVMGARYLRSGSWNRSWGGTGG